MKVLPARDFFFPARPRTATEQIELETRFFRHLRLPNGTYKTTYADRLPDVDAALCDLLAAARDGGERVDAPVRLLDVGVSSGGTTLELIETMEQRGLASETVAVDLAIDAYLRRMFGIADLLLDPQGKVLQVVLPFGVKGRPHDPSGSAARAALQRAFELTESLVGGAAGARRGEYVQLVSPRLLQRRDVTVVEHDLTRHNPAWVGRFDVVRGANILNLDYFDEGTLRAMLRDLTGYLRPGGLLVVVRTHDDTRTNHGTIFRLGEDGVLAPVARIGGGSEVEALAVEPSVAARS
jgi:hypothetical protein